MDRSSEQPKEKSKFMYTAPSEILQEVKKSA